MLPHVAFSLHSSEYPKMSLLLFFSLSTYFSLRGLFLTQPHVFIFLFYVTSEPHFPHSCPFLVEHLTVFIPVIGGVLFVFVIISLLRTSFTDPGILPRATPDEAADVEKQIGKLHPRSGHLLWDRWDKRALPYGVCHLSF